MPEPRSEASKLAARYRQILEQVEDHAIFTLTPEGCVESWNLGAEQVFGYLEPEILGQSGALIFTPEDRAEGVPAAEMATAARTGKAMDKRWHIRKDGSRFWANGVMSALREEDGALSGFAKILRDETKQRQTQEALRALNEKLAAQSELLEQQVALRTAELSQTLARARESELRFAQMFHAGPVPACLTAAGSGVVLELNAGFEQLSGYPREQVLGRSARSLDLWDAPSAAKLAAAQQAGSFRDLELGLNTKGGEVRVVLASGEALSAGGQRTHLEMFYDVTERRQTEEQLHRAIREAMSDTQWFSRQVMERLAQLRTGGEAAPPVKLTPREQDVLERLARGASNQQIADELGIAVQTVRNYISVLYEKLGVHSRAEAVVWARERGLAG